MARATPSRQLQPILNAAKRWIERSLVDDQSTFADERFWTLQNVDELKRAFVENLDEGAGSFTEKLSRQLSDSPAPARRLMAEMRWILGLFPTTAAPETKRAEFLAAWQFSGATMSSDHELLADEVLEP